MRFRPGIFVLVLGILYIFKNRIKKSNIFRSAGMIFNIVFYIYLIAIIAAFLYQVISNSSG